MKIEYQAIRYGPNAWLIHFSRQADENAWLISRYLVAYVEENPLPFLSEWTLSPTALLLEFLPGCAPLQAPSFPQEFHPSAVKERSIITIPVDYNGPDLERVAEHAKCSIRDVIELHSGATYMVHALGFAPGFAYLGGLPERLHTPRLVTPRTCIPAGSVGIGGPQTGIYPLATPGGWNIIGISSVPLFDPAKPLEQGFLLVRGIASNPRSMNEISLFPIAEVTHAGISTTLQDLGRTGAKKFGIPLGGVMDCTSAQQANHLLENPANAAVYEILGGIKLRCLRETWFCLTGAGTAKIDNQPIPYHRTMRWKKGEELSIHANASGLWAYLAIPGGWYGETYMGSRSVWPQAGMGHKLRMGDQLLSHSSEEYALPRLVAARSTPRNQIPIFPDKNQITSIRAWAGPQQSVFSDEMLIRFWQTRWTISLNSSRAGYRLEGQSLTTPEATMPSEPIVLGSIQVPPNGQPIILLNDGPTIGGYPKIALIHSQDMDVLRQLPPLSRIAFIRCE